MSYLLAYDVGTSGCKAVLLTGEAKVIASAYQAYPTHYPKPSWAEQDVQDWWRATAQTTRRLLGDGPLEPRQIQALTFSSQMLNTIAVNNQGELLRPCISWLDSRAREEARLVMRKLGGSALFAWIVGAELTGKDLLPKYLWLKRNEPEVYHRAAALLDAGGYLLLRATGRLICEWSVASVTGLFNLKRKEWDHGLMRLFGLDAGKFPDLVRSIDRVGTLTAAAASDLGLLTGTPVFGGAGDGQSTGVGSGAVGEADAHLALGTSGYVAIVTQRRLTGKRGIATIQSADPAKLLLIGEAETVGACLKWAAKELYGSEPEAGVLAQMDREVAETAPGAGDLIFTPWMYGERCPVPDESLRAAFINLGANHTRQQMARAIYEGVAFNFRWILDSLSELYGLHCDPLRVIGGGARGLPWLQIIADVTGRTLERVAHPQEASAVGAGLVAGIGLGLYPSFEAVKPLVPVDHVVVPDSSHHEIYERLYKAYRQVYSSLKGLYHSLNQH